MTANPRGYFEFTDHKGTKLAGRICTWSLNRFCKKMGDLTVTQLFSAITTGISIEAIAEILFCAVEYTHRGEKFAYTVDDAMDWIDDIGGLGPTIKIIEDAVSAKDEKGSKKKATTAKG